MRKSTFIQPEVVLVFNKSSLLIAVVCSLRHAAKLINGSVQSVSLACSGEYMTTKGWYFRKMHPKLEIEWSDLANLKLEDYDQMCDFKQARYHPRTYKSRKAKRKK
ncbi:MAG: hypothetical protein LUF04_11045 [Bacteroides sp.]|nr:hypothetical protein [Bacteroides sp.]